MPARPPRKKSGSYVSLIGLPVPGDEGDADAFRRALLKAVKAGDVACCWRPAKRARCLLPAERVVYYAKSPVAMSAYPVCAVHQWPVGKEFGVADLLAQDASRHAAG